MNIYRITNLKLKIRLSRFYLEDILARITAQIVCLHRRILLEMQHLSVVIDTFVSPLSFKTIHFWTD